MLTVASGPVQRTHQVLGPGLKQKCSGVNVEIIQMTGFLQSGRNSDVVMETLKCVSLLPVDPEAGSPPRTYRFKGS